MSQSLDLTGLKCPMPALMTRRALARLPPGGEIDVVADDPMAAVDIPHMCHHAGYEVLDTVRDGSRTRFTLRKPHPRQAQDED
jgi:tRNA 2-thiouridine synthesizing protein A